MEEIIHERLTEQGLRKTPLPLGTPSDKKHVPIFVDNDLEKKSRIIVIFGETNNMLGQLAGRVVVGPGGISKGSMVSVVEEARQQARRDHESDGGNSDASAPGIVLANTGELYWWPNESRALTIGASTMLPLPSMVHHGWRFRKEVNEIQGHETPQKHVVSIFDQVLLPLAAKDAKIDVIAIGDTCELVEGFLDDEASWNTWGPRLSSMVLIDPICDASKLVNEGFRAFLKKVSPT